MINEYQNLTNDILIDKIIQRADELTIQNDNIFDALTTEDFEQQLKINEGTMKDRAIVAWIPTKEEHLTLKGVHALGGRIVEARGMTYSDASCHAFTLSTNSKAHGHYIPIYV